MRTPLPVNSIGDFYIETVIIPVSFFKCMIVIILCAAGKLRSIEINRYVTLASGISGFQIDGDSVFSADGPFFSG